MRGHQELVNAQVNVNRCVFEINKPGNSELSNYKINNEYLIIQIDEAITQLRRAKELISGQTEIKI